MKTRFILLALLVVAALSISACGDDKKSEQSASSAAPAEYNYISADDTAKIVREQNPDYAIIDIQLKEHFDKQHLQGAIPTYAFPGDKPEMQEKLKAGLEQVKDNQKIIVVCPRGGGGAKNTVNYYRSIGVNNDRLLILEKGQEGWPASITDVMVGN